MTWLYGSKSTQIAIRLKKIDGINKRGLGYKTFSSNIKLAISLILENMSKTLNQTRHILKSLEIINEKGELPMYIENEYTSFINTYCKKPKERLTLEVDNSNKTITYKTTRKTNTVDKEKSKRSLCANLIHHTDAKIIHAIYENYKKLNINLLYTVHDAFIMHPILSLITIWYV